MNCNVAFEHLTSPDAAGDRELQQHLAECRRCRAMQETLSPALEWLSAPPMRSDNSSDSDEHRSVFLTDEAVQVAERAARRLVLYHNPSPARAARSRGHFARWAILACVASLCLLAVFVPSSRHASHPSARSTAAESFRPTTCVWLSPKEAGERTADQIVATCVTCHITLP
jgi:hypothetical protein